jgi:Tol biopolymer transport system component
MTPTPFERSLSAMLRTYAEPAVGSVDAAAVAHAVATERPRTRTFWNLPQRPLLRFAVVAAIVIAMVVVALAIGAIRRPDVLGRNGLLAIATNGGITVADPDGSGRRVLSAGQGQTSYPAWSPDGATIAFWFKSSDLAPAVLTLLDEQTGASTVIATLNAQSFPAPISWSPDGQALAFSAFSERSNPEVRVVRADGTQPLSLAPQLSASDPAWSPDGRQIAFRAPDPADLELVRLYVAAADGTGLRVLAALNPNPISDTQSLGLQLDWSPDGTQIAYATKGLSQAGGFVIAIADVATGVTRDLTSGPSGDSHPRWSPDGRWIAFNRATTSFTTDSNVALIRPDGSGLRTLTDTLVAMDTQTWSPDGTRIVALDPGQTQVVVIPIDGSAPSTFPAPGVKTAPSWQQLLSSGG